MNNADAIASIGFVATPYGGRFAVGENNGRGGTSTLQVSFGAARDLARQLAKVGCQVEMKPSGSPEKFILLT